VDLDITEDEPQDCLYCNAAEGVIFLCSDGWICEDCYRTLGRVPEEVGDEMHDWINSQDPRAEEFRLNIQFALDGQEDPDITGIPA